MRKKLIMMHVAMHDALNAIALEFIPYAFNGKLPEADAVVACSQAAFTVLLAEVVCMVPKKLLLKWNH